MATSVATPLERRLGVIAGVNEMTSSSGTGSTRINLQFDLNRNIDAAAREVQAAINAIARRPAGHAAQQPDLPQGQPVGRAGDHPGADLADAHAGPDLRRGLQHRAAEDRAGAGRGRRRARRRLAARGARRPAALRAEPLRHLHRGRARGPAGQQRQPAQGRRRGATAGGCRSTPATARPNGVHGRTAADYKRPGGGLAQRRGGAAAGRRPR